MCIISRHMSRCQPNAGAIPAAVFLARLRRLARVSTLFLGAAGEPLDSSFDTLARGWRTADHEDGVLAANRAKYIRKSFRINTFRDWLSPTSDRLDNQELRNALARCEKLRKKVGQDSSRIFSERIRV